MKSLPLSANTPAENAAPVANSVPSPATGAANNFDPAGLDPVVQREGRLSERSPADSVGLTQVGRFMSYKAINSRTDFGDPGPSGFDWLIIGDLGSLDGFECIGCHTRSLLHLSGDHRGGNGEASESNDNRDFQHFEFSKFPMFGVNTC